MNLSNNIRAFDAAGASSLLPIYHFNARAIDALAPRGAHVLDLGSGSGRFLAYLAMHRPDLRITGLDAAENMLNAGTVTLAQAGLKDRVRLKLGDMRKFRQVVRDRVDLISSVFSLHHLAAQDDLIACLSEISRTVADDGASLWIFDHARPRQRQTAVEFPEIFTPDAARAFREDSCNSLIASWTYSELQAAMRTIFPGLVNSRPARLLPLYQIHWMTPRHGYDERETTWLGNDKLTSRARSEAKMLAKLFRSTPQQGG